VLIDLLGAASKDQVSRMYSSCLLFASELRF
jgi:hypothetical protein